MNKGRSMHWTSESEQLAAATMNHTMVEKELIQYNR
jgi:hypothetical protein